MGGPHPLIPVRHVEDQFGKSCTVVLVVTRLIILTVRISYGGLFSRRRSSDNLSDRSWRRSDKPESSILAARQKVADAEKAERMASDALRQTRNAAHEATEHIRLLENEAREE